MTKSIWLENGIHMDLSDDATAEDVATIKAYADKLIVETRKRKAAFNHAWEAAQATGDKEAAWKWFDTGCDWISQRQAQ
jgi:hypothetical protein